LAPFDTLFVLKTGNGDELSWMRKVVLDQDLNVEIIDLGRVVQFFLPGIKEHSFQELYEKYLNKKYKPSKNLMYDTLSLGEKLLREIVYLFSKTDSPFNTYLVDLTEHVLGIPELNAVKKLISSCKSSRWLADDLLAHPNSNHKDFNSVIIEGEVLLKHIIPTKNMVIKRSADTLDDAVAITPDITGGFFESDFIKQKLHGYEKRDSQVEYAKKVTETLNDPIHYYIEAPTGIGKSLGYLIPSGFYLEKNPMCKIIIATSTKNLQNQIIERDWPLVKSRFPELRISTLKGKSNYICISALARQYHHTFGTDVTTEERASWLYLALFCDQTDGDIEFIPYQMKKWLPPINDLLKDVQANLHCTLNLCKPANCTYGKQLQKAELAHIIITNHFKSVLMNEGLLGKTRAIIVDEGERFGDNIRQALSIQIDSRQIKRLFYRLCGNKNRKGFLQVIESNIHHLGKRGGSKTEGISKANDIIKNLINNVNLSELNFMNFLLNIFPENGYLPALLHQFPALRNSKDSLTIGLQPVLQNLGRLIDGLTDLQRDEIPLIKQFKQRCETYRVLVEELHCSISDFIYGFMTPQYAHSFKGHPDRVWSLTKIPIDIVDLLNDSIYTKVGHVIFTSATLFIDGDASHFISDYGSLQANENVKQSCLPHVFDYQKNTVCFVDGSITTYNYKDCEMMKAYRKDVNDAICSYTLAANGRTLILFTSTEELNRSFDMVAPFFLDNDILPLRQNGSSLEEIREFNHNEYSVLFGVDRFWSGVDFPGSTLSQVIITKAPNPNLNNPLIAHHRHYESSTFMQEKYPIYGRLKLKQGFGRLVRAMKDRGGVIILDSRYENSTWLYCHLSELPTNVSFSDNQEIIMRRVLEKAGLKSEFHQRRIDPFLETQKYGFKKDESYTVISSNGQKIRL